MAGTLAKAKISQWAQEVASVKRAKHGRADFFFERNGIGTSLSWTKLIFSFGAIVVT